MFLGSIIVGALRTADSISIGGAWLSLEMDAIVAVGAEIDICGVSSAAGAETSDACLTLMFGLIVPFVS